MSLIVSNEVVFFRCFYLVTCLMLLYSFAEVSFRHKIIRYLKAGKGTSFHQLLDIRRAIQQANPTLIAVAMAGDHHISGASTEEDEELLMDYFQSSEFVTERLVWAKDSYATFASPKL